MIERAYYSANISAFLSVGQAQILGELTKKHNFALDITQKNAWIEQITKLKVQLHNFSGGEIFLEFSIPRMGKRVDVLLIIAGVIFVIEYKAGAQSHDLHAIDQVTDYALDLKNFHEGTHNRFVVPILLASNANRQISKVEWSSDGIAVPLLSDGNDLSEIISQTLSDIPAQKDIDVGEWASKGYKPTPTIVETAQALYRNHSVEEISRSDAGAKNLTRTTRCISEIIDSSKKNRRKSICFVTGVPGAGKTLAGLNIATQQLRSENERYAVFLSGNGPLVSVLREALARDEVLRAKDQGLKLSK